MSELASGTHPKQRLQSLDVLRGVAILGILLANIAVFAGPYAFTFSPVSETWSRLTETTTLAFVTGKWRSLLAILFGVGLYLQFQRRAHDTALWPGGYLKRTFFLGVIGLIHGFLIWWGDILFLYSVIAFVACFLVRAEERTFRTILWVGGVLSALVAIAALAIGFVFSNGDVREFFGDELVQAEVAAYTSGSYVDQLGIRATYFIGMVGSSVAAIPFILPLFVIGMWWTRDGVLAAPSRHPRARRLALGWGLGLGLPLNLLAYPLLLLLDPNFAITIAWEILFGPLLAIGIAMGGAVVLENARRGTVTNSLAAVGKTALTCYLMQSVLATTLFYGFGFGLFATLTPPQRLAVVVAIWIVNIAFAVFWLRRFDIGPVEWLWRSMTEGRRMPWRLPERTPPPEVAPASPTAPGFQI